MGNIGPTRQRYEVLPDVLDLARLERESTPATPAAADASPTGPAVGDPPGTGSPPTATDPAPSGVRGPDERG